VGGWVGREGGMNVDTTIMMILSLCDACFRELYYCDMHALESLDIDIEISSQYDSRVFFLSSRMLLGRFLGSNGEEWSDIR